MQSDDTANPGMLWVLDGEKLWNGKAGTAGKACADCHQDARVEHEGRRGPLSRLRHGAGSPVDLEQRINLCRVRHQQATPLAYESRDLLALTALVARAVTRRRHRDGRRSTTRALHRHRPRSLSAATGAAQPRLRQLPRRQLGQASRRGHHHPGHPTGYPLYRLEWQSLGSLQRRLRACLSGVRARPYKYGAPEMVELELYLMWRARGMPIETPAVRP